jgi:hypothetical protein
MAKALPSAAAAAQAWQSGFGNAGTKWAAGINSVQVAPGIAAAAAKDRYVSGVTQNADKFAANVASVSLQDWKSMAVNKGQARLASGATAGAPKYQAKIGPVLQAIGQIRDSLPPRGDIMTNLERSRQMALGLNQRAQQGF